MNQNENALESKNINIIENEMRSLSAKTSDLHIAAQKISDMYALKVKNLGMIADFSNMVEGLVSDTAKSEMRDGLAVRRFRVDLPEGKTARYNYAFEYENGKLKTIREKAVIEIELPNEKPQTLISTNKKFDFQKGWISVDDSKEESASKSVAEKQAEKPEGVAKEKEQILSVPQFTQKSMENTKELDNALSKIIAFEIARAQEIMLQLPTLELKRVSENLEKSVRQEKWNTVVKLPQEKEIRYEQVLNKDESGKIKYIEEEIRLPDGEKQNSIIETQEISQEERDKLQSIVATVNKRFQENLWLDADESQNARKYLASRGFSEDEMKKFGFGLAMGKEIYGLAKSRVADKDELIRAGLARSSSEEIMKPVFFNRITIPVKNEAGQEVGFVGRLYSEKNDGLPKYINSPRSALFSKKDLIFGLDSAKEAILREKNVYVTKGCLDALALQKAGISNAVALMGTIFTTSQKEALKKMAPEIRVFGDSDNSAKVLMESIKKVVNKDMTIREISGLGSKDPSEFGKCYGDKALADSLQNKEKQGTMPAKDISILD